MVLGAILGGAAVLALVGVVVLLRRGMFRSARDPAAGEATDADAGAGRPRTARHRFAAASERLVALPADLLPGIHQLLRQRQKIQAVKLVKDRTGWSLRDAKDAVDAIEAGAPAPVPQSRWPVLSELPPDLANAVQELLVRRQKIQAIKLVRERTSLSLRDAKEMVDGIQHGRPSLAGHPAPNATSLPPMWSPPPSSPNANGTDLASRARQLKLAGQEVRAVRLVRAETGMGITEATAFVRSLT